MAQPLPDVDPRWSELPIIEEHVDILVRAAVSPEIAEAVGVRSLTRIQDLVDYAPGISQRTSMLGLLIPWRAPDGRIVPQIRLDVEIETADNKKIKYMSPSKEDLGGEQPFGVMRSSDPGAEYPTLLIVEGGKQAMAMASCLPAYLPVDVWAMQGCWGWSHADTYLVNGRDVVACLDADMSTNLDVYRAAKQMQENLDILGARSVKFIKVPATGKDGVDDWLGRLPEPARGNAAENLLDRATDRLGRAPAARRRLSSVGNNTGPTSQFIDQTGRFLPQDAADAYSNEFPVGMLEGDSNPWVYTGRGVYTQGLESVLGIFCVRMGNEYQVSQKNALSDKLSAMAFDGIQLPYFTPEPWLNCRNGVVNLDTLEFTEHSPDYPCTIQIPFDYNPDAKCPVFDNFLAVHAGEQADSLLEHSATMLDHTKAPEKSIMMYGGSGTGKSTYMKFMDKLAGEYVSHQSLQAVSEDKFSQAQLHNKILNSCGDLSSKSINDPSQFKQVTGGGDPIEAQKKYGKHVKFRPRALQLFSMNQVPRVSENSNAFFRRVVPYKFDVPYTNPVNEYIENNEMEGILARLVLAAHNMRKRGKAIPPLPEVVKDYEGKVCRARGWFYENAELCPEGVAPTPTAELYGHFLAKTEEASEKTMTKISFTARLKTIDGVEASRPYIMGKQIRCLNIRLRADAPEGPTDDDGGDDNPYGDPTPPPPPTPEEPAVEQVPITIDLETGSVEDMFASDDPGFIRLVGTSTDGENVEITTEVSDLTGVPLIGQNVIAYDLAVLARRGLYDLDPVIAGEVEVYDTMLAARLSDPPPARQSNAQERGRYSLAGLANRFGLPIEKDVLPRLAKEYGGWDQIPQDNEEYREYLRKDVVTTAQVAKKLGPLDAYAKREMRVAAIAAQISSTGIRINKDLLEERVESARVRKEKALTRLQQDFGLPTEGKSPHASAAGKEALKKAFQAAGIRKGDVTKTDKGEVSFGKDAMDLIIERCTKGYRDVQLVKDPNSPTGLGKEVVEVGPNNRPDLLELAHIVKELNGIRTVYGTVFDHLHGDRVYPEINLRQASGRWSITKPGLTVIGKRGENANEREIFLPEPGHVFLSCDLAQVDARCVAALSECDGYREMFTEGKDLHREVAVAIFNDGSDEARQMAKIVSHGWNYGATPNGIAFATGVDVSVAEEYDRTATLRFPGVVEWRKRLVTLTEQGIYLDNGWGRKLLGDPQRARTQSPGLVGQSAARDILMECIFRMPTHIRKCLRLTIHDELLFSVPEDKFEEYRDEALAAMSFTWKGIEFMGDSSKAGNNWMHCYRKGE